MPSLSMKRRDDGWVVFVYIFKRIFSQMWHLLSLVFIQGKFQKIPMCYRFKEPQNHCFSQC